MRDPFLSLLSPAPPRPARRFFTSNFRGFDHRLPPIVDNDNTRDDGEGGREGASL